MIFTSFVYLYFFLIVFVSFWAAGGNLARNLILLVASYIFYGWVSPWFCILLAVSTVVDYFCGLGMRRHARHKKKFLLLSLLTNLGILGVFKYFNFFAENFAHVLDMLGLGFHPLVFQIVLPVGISFYTFQTLSYSIDIYRGQLEPRTNFIHFATFVAFFPQLVAGPIERAKTFLPQLEQKKVWSWETFDTAWPLILRGYFKKLVIADNVAVYADKVYMLDEPGLVLLCAGTAAFGLQIFADFSGYTDIARGTARLFGFELMRNFDNPYLAVTPSDFWRRWHISLSTWIRDYLFIPLGGSRHESGSANFAVIMVTMTLCGLWHGAAWNYICWGVYHGLLLATYHALGLGGRWRPAGVSSILVSWAVMICFTLFGWFLFRSSSMTWALNALSGLSPVVETSELLSALVILVNGLLLSVPLAIMAAFSGSGWMRRAGRLCGSVVLLLLIVIYARDAGQDFIYFQF